MEFTKKQIWWDPRFNELLLMTHLIAILLAKAFATPRVMLHAAEIYSDLHWKWYHVNPNSILNILMWDKIICQICNYWMLLHTTTNLRTSFRYYYNASPSHWISHDFNWIFLVSVNLWVIILCRNNCFFQGTQGSIY
jgi:hypothetical protein